MKLARLFQRRDLWTIGLYRFSCVQDFTEPKKGQLIRQIGESGYRFNRSYQSTTADPFLFASDDRLFLFYEAKTDHSHGEIWVQSMSLDETWTVHGCALREPFHLSYPQVFSYGGSIFMVPEAAQSGQVLLYISENFPLGWKRHSTLINAPLRDPTLLIRESGDVFLFATTADFELKLYHATSLHRQFRDTGFIITTDKSIARCAGGIFALGDDLVRPAQDCSEEYGKDIHFRGIQNISDFFYNEKPLPLSLHKYEDNWMKNGSHHISMSKFNNLEYVAIDGRQRDRILNSILLGFLKIIT